MYKRIFIISALLVISIFVVVVHYKKDNNDIKKGSKNMEENIEYFNDNVLTNMEQFSKHFSDRYIIINRDELCIGKSKNELENDYYDIDIKIKDKYIELYINKLFKEFDKNVICDEIYVGEITEYIKTLFNLKIDTQSFSKLIITNYELIRDIDRKNVQSVDKTVSISNVNIVITTFQNMLLLKLGDV